MTHAKSPQTSSALASRTSPRLLLATLLGATLAATVYACGGGNDNLPPPPPPPPPPASASAAPLATTPLNSTAPSKAPAPPITLTPGAASPDPAAPLPTVKLSDEKRIPYDLTFEGDDGRTYRLRGQRDFFVHDAVDSLTILPASLFDEAGVEVGRAVLRFDPKNDLGALVKSFRPRMRISRLASGLD